MNTTGASPEPGRNDLPHLRGPEGDGRGRLTPRPDGSDWVGKSLALRTFRSVGLVLVPFLLLACSGRPPVRSETTPVHREELDRELADPRLLGRFGVEELVLLEVGVDRVTIAAPNSNEALGEMYYTLQNGWHLKAPNELMIRVPGKGWLIAEQ